MIEFKDVTAKQKGKAQELKAFSQIFRDGEIRHFSRAEGELIINVILGFCPHTEGFVTFDGMPLDERSVTFMRKLIAYIPSPDDFPNVANPTRKQLEMIAEALQSDSNIILAVEPFSHLNEEQTHDVMTALRKKAENHAVVIIASERPTLD